MVSNYDLAGMGIYPYNSTSMPYVSWEAFSHSREHVHATDIVVDDNQYILRINLAGYNKENIKVKTQSDKLIILAAGSHDISRELKVISREIQFGEFRREYCLNNIDYASITAKLECGILTINLPKTSQCSEDDQRDVDFE